VLAKQAISEERERYDPLKADRNASFWRDDTLMIMPMIQRLKTLEQKLAEVQKYLSRLTLDEQSRVKRGPGPKSTMTKVTYRKKALPVFFAD